MSYNKNITYWPEPAGLFQMLKSPASVGRSWSNIKIYELKGLVSALVHDPLLAGDTVMIRLTMLDTSIIKTVAVLSHTTVLTNIDAYYHDVMSEVMTSEVKKREANTSITLACQIYGDFWVVEGENS